ncbi:hypothetical protein MNB_SV-9-1203 [hydrothermal vent metagenome]|uniref:Sulfur carrier protein ThiS n=1 Tax=hydrothermal vent metagenome TaxID=652676 RepID=A0A1W1C862_9ZZZZ
MNIKVNGEVKEYPDNLTLDKLIDDLGIKDKVMASAVNMEIVKKDNWSSCILKDGDIIELLDFVGGG